MNTQTPVVAGTKQHVMARVKFGLSRLNAEGTVLKANHVINHLTGNIYFPTPNPTIPTVETAVDYLGDAIIAAQNGGSDQIDLRNLRTKEVKTLLKELGVYVQDESKGDEMKILSSGFDVIVRGGPVGPLPAATNVTGKTGAAIGTSELHWDKVKGAGAYIVEKTSGDPSVEAGWTVHGYTTRSRYVATGLTTGQVNWFRIKAIGAAGVGAQSDPVRSVAQ
jgi:hypothetical protein